MLKRNGTDQILSKGCSTIRLINRGALWPRCEYNRVELEQA